MKLVDIETLVGRLRDAFRKNEDGNAEIAEIRSHISRLVSNLLSYQQRSEKAEDDLQKANKAIADMHALLLKISGCKDVSRGSGAQSIEAQRRSAIYNGIQGAWIEDALEKLENNHVEAIRKYRQ